jgi:hypothetical protein
LQAEVDPMPITLRVVVVLALLAAPAFAQSSEDPAPEKLRFSGPRFGVTLLSDGIVDKLAERSTIVRSPVSQFGWQFEKIFFNRDEPGPSIVSEWVLLAGGLDQGVILPSLTWLVGIRTFGGTEFGAGPNVTPAGTALALAFGRSFRISELHVPVNIAVVPSKSGVRVSLLTGFNRRRR